MSIVVICPNGHRMNVPEHLAGKSGKCSKCGTAVIVARAEVALNEEDPDFELVHDKQHDAPHNLAHTSPTAESGTSSEHNRRRSASSPAATRSLIRRPVVLVAGGSALALILVVATAFVFWRKNGQNVSKRQTVTAAAGTILSVDFDDGVAGFGGTVFAPAKNERIQLTVNFLIGITPEEAKSQYVGVVLHPAADSMGEDILGYLVGAKVFSATVLEFKEAGAPNDYVATIQVGPAAAQELKGRNRVILVKPRGATSAQLDLVPDIAVIEPSPVGAAITQASANLNKIGLALINFGAGSGFLPPAVVFGPDGKPWHSWRVLILPYLEQQAIYNEYDFTVPWDDPKNLRLLDKMPPVYRDPISGESSAYFTHFAAVTGVDTAFPPEGQKMKDGKLPAWQPPGVARPNHIVDSHLTILAGSVSPERRIPWTKPEDVVIGPEFQNLATADGFAFPYKGAGLFLMADTRVKAIKQEIPLKVLAAMFPTKGRKMLREDEIPIIDSPGFPHGFEFVRTPTGVKAVGLN